MSTDPLSRLHTAFGDELVRYRNERKVTVDALASGAGLCIAEVKGLERGDYGPTLKDVFRLASALGEEPLMLLVDVVAAWRADSSDILHQSRPSDFPRLFRLGYHHKPGDFREQERTYGSDTEAMHAADRLNQQRHQRGVALLDTVCIYIRVAHMNLSWKPTAGGSP